MLPFYFLNGLLSWALRKEGRRQIDFDSCLRPWQRSRSAVVTICDRGDVFVAFVEIFLQISVCWIGPSSAADSAGIISRASEESGGKSRPCAMPSGFGDYLRRLFVLLALLPAYSPGRVDGRRIPETDPSQRLDESLAYLWPLPKEFQHGNETLTVDPNLVFHLQGPGGNSSILGEALERYRSIIFRHRTKLSGRSSYDLRKLTINVASDDDTVNYQFLPLFPFLVSLLVTKPSPNGRILAA